jgi:hypothetical protein
VKVKWQRHINTDAIDYDETETSQKLEAGLVFMAYGICAISRGGCDRTAGQKMRRQGTTADSKHGESTFSVVETQETTGRSSIRYGIVIVIRHRTNSVCWKVILLSRILRKLQRFGIVNNAS